MVRLRAHSYGLLGTPSTQAGEPHFLLLVKRAEEPQQGRPEDDGRLLHGGKTLAQNFEAAGRGERVIRSILRCQTLTPAPKCCLPSR